MSRASDRDQGATHSALDPVGEPGRLKFYALTVGGDRTDTRDVSVRSLYAGLTQAV